MDFYRELYMYKRLNAQIRLMNDYAARLNAQSGRRGASGKLNAALEEKRLQLNTTIELLTSLQAKLASYYTPIRQNPKEYRKLSAGNLQELKTLYTYTKQVLTNTKNALFPTDNDKNSKEGRAFTAVEGYLTNDIDLVKRMSEKDGLSLPASTFKIYTEITKGHYNNPDVQFKWPGFFAYGTLYTDDTSVTTEDVLRIYINKTPEEVREEYESKVATVPRLYEYPPTQYRLDAKIRNTGNIQKINDYLAEDDQKQNPDDKLTLREREMLIHHRDATVKVNNINNSVQSNMNLGLELGHKPAFVVNTPNQVELNVHQPNFQTSLNGCWSCAGALMASSRGISNVTQEDIRAYRPDIPEDEVVRQNDDVDDNYSTDNVKSMAENADSILMHAPNSMLHTLEILPYSIDNEINGYTSKRYVQNTVNLLRKQITHALREDQSPVGFYLPNHYITIIGIKGDVVSYKDSNKSEEHKGDPDKTFTSTLWDLVNQSFFEGVRPNSIEINWLSDIKLAEDQKTIHGVPSEYVYMKEDGTVTQQPKAMRDAMGNFDGSKLNRMGNTVLRSAQDEDQIYEPAGENKNNYGTAGVQMMERVYLPKKVNAAYLKTMAEKRSAQDEEKLNQADRDIYNIKEGKKDPDLAENEILSKLRAIANEAPEGFYDHDIKDEINDKEINDNQINDENEFEISTSTKPEKKPQVVPVVKTEDKKEGKKVLSEESQGKKQDDKRSGRIEDMNRPYLDDTRINIHGGTNGVFDKVFDNYFKKEAGGNKNNLDRQKKAIADKEKGKGQELKDQYTFSYIRSAAEVLLENLNQHKHFYLWGTISAYKELIGTLQEVRKYANKALAHDENHPFTRNDAKKLVLKIDKASKTSLRYLTEKQKEMEKDPLRRNDPGKVKYEQPRIGAVLDAYDIFSEMALSMRARENNTKDILQLDNERKANYNHFLRELVADSADPQRTQEATIKNRLYIPEKQKNGLDRLEKMFGFIPGNLKEFDGVAEMNTLGKIEKGFVQIGGSSKAERLSNKDFAALAIAASTTSGCMNNNWITSDPTGRFTVQEKTAYYSGQLLFNVINSDRDSIRDNIGSIRRSRSFAEEAMKDYERGSKDKLARLIAEGIKNITEFTSTGRFAGNKTMELYASEMALRMKSMVERDQQLMKRAMEFGLTPKMLKDIKNKGIEAENGCLAEARQKEGTQIGGNKWGILEKERNYVDMLMTRYLDEVKDINNKETVNSPKYKEEVRKVEQRYKNEMREAKSAYDEACMNAIRETDSYKGALKIQQAVNQIDDNKANKTITRNDIRTAMLDNLNNITKQISLNMKAYEDGLIKKHEEYIRTNHAKDWQGGYDAASREIILTKALERERSLIPVQEPKSKEEIDWDKYSVNKTVISAVKQAKSQYESRQNAIKEAKNVNIHTLKTKMAQQNPIMDELSSGVKKQELRSRLRTYIRENGYLNYSPKNFIEKVVGTDQKKPTVRTTPLQIDLIRFETRDAERKVREPAMDKGAEVIAKPKVRKVVSKEAPVKKSASKTKPVKPKAKTTF